MHSQKQLIRPECTIKGLVQFDTLHLYQLNCQTLTPTRTPLSLISLTKDMPLSECWYSVSWKKMTPPRQLLMRSSAVKRICRNCLRFSSVFSTPTWASRLAMLPVIHTSYLEVNVHTMYSLDGCVRVFPKESVLQTHRLIRSQDALPRRNDA